MKHEIVSGFISKRVLSFSLLMLLSTFMHARKASFFEAKRVYWNKFEAVVTNDNMVLLTWNVTEYNNKSFLVQHSVNGTNWENIALVFSKSSAESMTDYSYTIKII